MLTSLLGGAHPQDGDVMLYGLRIRSGRLEKDTATFDCIGTEAHADTDRIVVPVPSQELVPIEAHPDFFTESMCGPESDLTDLGSGLYAEGLNGSRFSMANGKITSFLGFLGDDAPDELRGVRSYQRNTPVLRATWYTWSEPTFLAGSKIVEAPLNAPTLEGITNYLRSAPVGSRVGGYGGDILHKMNAEYVGSETGWSTIIYGSPVEE